MAAESWMPIPNVFIHTFFAGKNPCWLRYHSATILFGIFCGGHKDISGDDSWSTDSAGLLQLHLLQQVGLDEGVEATV
jgi:hypothetical protein